MPTVYELLKKHLHTHAYKRGAHIGDAPADKFNRRKTDYRVRYLAQTDTYQVILYRTPLLSAYPDGTFALNTGGYHTQSTFKCLNLAMRLFVRHATGCEPYIGNHLYRGLRQLCISALNPTTRARSILRFYDHMKFSPEGAPLTPLQPFERRHIDLVRAKEFRQQTAEFRRTLPLLHATLPDTRQADALATYADLRRQYYDLRLSYPDNLLDAMHNKPELWPVVVDSYSYQGYWAGAPKHSLDTVWRGMSTLCKRQMYVTSVTDVTEL